MQNQKVNKADLEKLEEILSLIDQRKGLYSQALIKGIYARTENERWKSVLTTITFLATPFESADQQLDYGSIRYVENVLPPDECSAVIRNLTDTGVLEIPGFSVQVGGPNFRSEASFQDRDVLNLSSTYLKTDWPTNFHVYRPAPENRGLVHERLVSLNQPYYPDVRHLAADKFGQDLERANRFWGDVLLFIPDYRARLFDVKLGTASMAISVESGSIPIGGLVAKVYASDRQQFLHEDIKFDGPTESVQIGFSPSEIEICLLDAGNGDVIDEWQLFSYQDDFSSRIDPSDPEVLRFLTQQGEGQHLEYKPGKLEPKDRDELAETAVAYANRDGGRILVGVDDEGKIIGCFEKDVVERVSRIISDRCDPPIEPSVYAVELDDKTVYVVEISESSNKPHLLRGRGPLIRRGSNDMPMTRTELEEIIDLRNARG